MCWVSHMGNWVLENALGRGAQIHGVTYPNKAFVEVPHVDFGSLCTQTVNFLRVYLPVSGFLCCALCLLAAVRQAGTVLLGSLE